MLTEECIVERVRRFFEPHRGEAVVSDNGKRVRISVYDGTTNKLRLKPAVFRLEILRNEFHLDNVLTDIKGQIPAILTG